MVLTTRRAVLAGAGALAAGTVAVAALMRKPAPHIYTPIADPASAPAGEKVELQGARALVATAPPVPEVDFGFVDGNGTARRIGGFAGHGVIVNLWATWCVPCVAELPALAALARQLGPEGVVVLPLSSDRGGAPVVSKFYRSHDITGLDVWLDPQGEAARTLGARGVPTTIVIDRAGRERARLEGAADWAAPEMLTALRQLTA